MTRHRWLLLRAVLYFALAVVLPVQPIRAESACTGDAECTACQNCHACQHCARQHGTCGVEERIKLTAEQRERAAFAGSWNVLSSGGPGREETLQPDGSALTADEGAGRWSVAGGHLFVHFDDPGEDQQAYDVSTANPVLSGQDQAGHVLTLQRRADQPATPAPAPSATTPSGEAASLSAPPDSPAPSEAADLSAAQLAVPLSTCVGAIAAQSDAAKLGTLGRPATNPRLKRILYYLAAARDGGADPAEVIEQAQRANGSLGTPRAPLVKASLLRNLKICDGLGLLTPENRARLRHG